MMDDRQTDHYRMLDIGGVAIEVHEFGAGEPLLYLHGGYGLLYDLPFLQRLAAKRRIIAPSHPGFGRSALPDWLDDVDDISHVHLEALHQMGIDCFDCLGASLGGWIAADLATKIPERINRLALIAPMGVKLGSEEQLDIPDLFVARPEAVERMTFADPQKARLDYASMTDEELGRIARDRETHTLLVWEPYMHSAKLRHRLHRLRMPALFLRGAQDGVVSADYLAGYAGLAPHARVETVPAAGHLPQFEQAEATASLIESFLTGPGA